MISKTGGCCVVTPSGQTITLHRRQRTYWLKGRFSISGALDQRRLENEFGGARASSCLGWVCCALGWSDGKTISNDTESEFSSCGGESLQIHHLGWVVTPYRKQRRREYGGGIAQLGEKVLFHVQGLNWKFPRMWKNTMDGQDVVGPTITSWVHQRTRGGPRLHVPKWFPRHRNRSSVCYPQCRYSGQVYLTRGVVERLGPHGWVQGMR